MALRAWPMGLVERSRARGGVGAFESLRLTARSGPSGLREGDRMVTFGLDNASRGDHA